MLDLSPSLLLGLVVAGALHVFLPKGMIRRGLNRPNLMSVLRSVLIGVPMPLCSCGVIPTAISLKKEGASKGAATAFLISTPQTGVDSILVSAAFLGWPFAVFKVAAAFVTGLIGGVLANRFGGQENEEAVRMEYQAGFEKGAHDNRLIEVIRYALFDLLAMIDLWIVVGVLVAAAITTAVPLEFLHGIPWIQGLAGMLVMLALAIPLYVCTTGSVPIAASLIAAGMPVGTALVFLMAGPATNVATIGAVYRGLGWRILTVYLGTVIIMSVVFGLGFDFVLSDKPQITSGHEHGFRWIGTVSSAVLMGLLVYLLMLRVRKRVQRIGLQTRDDTVDMTLEVEGMSCQHCVTNVKRALESFDEVEEATPDLSSGIVQIQGRELDASALSKAVELAGYRVKRSLSP